jgi:glycerol uptake facilitator-like aquaporin
MFGRAEHLGANMPHVGIVQSLVTEIIFTFLLLTIILSTAKQHKLVGPNGALAVGLTIALSGLVGGPVSGASMNPARSAGPALLAGGDALAAYWIYLIGPAIGATLAALTITLMHGRPNCDEEREATGAESQLEP